MPRLFRALLGALLVAGSGSARGQEAALPDATPSDSSDTAAPKYIFAAEDTLKLPALFHMSPIDITADRLEISEIVRRCIERDEEVRALIDSWVHTQIVKTVLHVGGYGDEADRLVIREQVDRVFNRKPDYHETVPLKFEEYVLENGERRPPNEEEGREGTLSFGDLDRLPFYLEDNDDYTFDILSREIVGNRVIYEVRLTPKSDFEIAPTGRIWVDTSNFQILREEFDFEGRVPLGFLIKSLGPMVREREAIGDLWVWKRWIARAQLRDGVIKTMARLTFQKTDEIPHTIEMLILFQDHLVNDAWTEPVPATEGDAAAGADVGAPPDTVEVTDR